VGVIGGVLMLLVATISRDSNSVPLLVSGSFGLVLGLSEHGSGVARCGSRARASASYSREDHGGRGHRPDPPCAG
jgi:hypothetical protein